MGNRIAILALFCLALVACGSSPRIDWANERGGVVSYDGSTDAKAMVAADHVCGRSSRRAQVVTMNDDDKKITFNCVE